MSYVEKMYEILESDTFMVLSDCVVTSKDNKLYVVSSSRNNEYDVDNIKVLNGDAILSFCTKYASEINFAYDDLCQVRENNEVKRAAM